MILKPSSMPLRAPIVVVGSGPAGIAVARALEARRLPCWVLEAGQDVPLAAVERDLEIVNEGHRLTGATLARTRQIGGGLNLWGGQLALPRHDESAATGDAPAGWPIDLSEIWRRAPAAAELLGQSITMDLSQETSLLPARESLSAYGMELVTTAWLKEPKLPRRIWKAIENSELINLVQGALVTGLRTDTNGTTIGLVFHGDDGVVRQIATGTIVLTCGALETSRLLMLPVGEHRAPWGNLNWLGRGFCEHLDAAVGTFAPRNEKALLDIFDPVIIGKTRYSCKTFSQEIIREQDRNYRLSAAGMLTLPGNTRNALAEVRMLANALSPRAGSREFLGLMRAGRAASAQALPLAWRYLRHKRIATMLRGAASLRVSLEQPVRFKSRIQLAETCDSAGVPQIRLNWIRGEAEGIAFRAKAIRIRNWAHTSGAAEVAIDPMLIEDPTGFAMQADEGLHHCGGARMAIGPADGVVDTDLAVFGTRGLYCCGSATFPRLGFANPTFSAVALADRLAEHLANKQT
ncbi:hypothetical protein GVM20_00420 [Porphyrobacter sp. SLTP]|uniref:GMC oxidoreductase n=1 Tax=Porphyrobacter sp. SLTP TaxID=2683266 RepID=UPI001412512A|nr:GMC oxidoreductase [Porphyrobacter sp. SLTP]NBB23586.1 hypothetical protein [Porphyrobacter sp. SLTP]